MNAFEYGFFDELEKIAAKNRGAGGPRPANIPKSLKKGERDSIRYKKPGSPAPSAVEKIQAPSSQESSPNLPVPISAPADAAPAKPGMSNLAKGLLGGGAAIVGGLAIRNYLRRRKLEKARADQEDG